MGGTCLRSRHDRDEQRPTPWHLMQPHHGFPCHLSLSSVGCHCEATLSSSCPLVSTQTHDGQALAGGGAPVGPLGSGSLTVLLVLGQAAALREEKQTAMGLQLP